MRPIPLEMRKEMNADPKYHVCSAKDQYCRGKIEWHHVWIYAGKQINEKWAIIPLCKLHHDLAGIKPYKEHYELTSLIGATEEDFKKYSRKNWEQHRLYLIKTLL